MSIENSGANTPPPENTSPSAEVTAIAPENSSYLRGFGGALAGALIGAIPWTLVGLMGWILAYLGLVIGFCACKGYRLAKGRGGWPAAALIVAAILISVIVGTFGSYILQVLKPMQLTLAGGFDYVVSALKTEAAVRLSFVKSLGVGMLFSILGCLEWFFYKVKIKQQDETQRK
jgi:hypothetical protein